MIIDTLISFYLPVIFLLPGAIILVFLHKFKDKRYSYVVLGLSIGTFLLLSFVFYKYTVDDTYISLRYARNLADGYGLVFNTDGSTPVEGYTNFLWVIVETPFFLLSLPDKLIIHSVKLIGVTFGIGVLIMTYNLTRLLTSDTRAGLLSAFLLAAIPYLSFWAVGGLETTMYIFWLLTALYTYLVELRDNKVHIWSMGFFTLAALTRPEGLFFVLVILLWELAVILLTKNRAEVPARIRNVMPGLIVFVMVYGVYFFWRYNFYDYLLPNTFYARSETIGIKHIMGRAHQINRFIVYLLPIVAIVLFRYFQFPKSSNRQKIFLSVAFLVLVAFSFVAKTEWMPGYRYELPFVPILISFFSVSICQMLFGDKERPTFNWQTLVVNFGILICIGIYLLYPAITLRQNTSYTDHLNRSHVALGKWLKQYAPQEASYASWDLGAVPYYSKLPRIIEIYPDAILSTYITHNGYDVDYLLSLNPSFVVLPNPSQGVYESNWLTMYEFYSKDEFKQRYELIFSLANTENYILDVYKHRELYLSQEALDEGKKLEAQSLHEVNLDASFREMVIKMDKLVIEGKAR